MGLGEGGEGKGRANGDALGGGRVGGGRVGGGRVGGRFDAEAVVLAREGGTRGGKKTYGPLPAACRRISRSRESVVHKRQAQMTVEY